MSAEKQPPSAAKLRKLRKKGTLPTSSFATSSAASAAIAGVFALLLHRISGDLLAIWHACLHQQDARLLPHISAFLLRCLGWLSIGGCIAFMVQIAQSRGYARAPKPSMQRLKPFASYKNRFSKETLVTLVAQIVVIVPPMWVGVLACLSLQRTFIESSGGSAPLAHSSAGALRWLGRLLLTLAISHLAGGVLDAMLRRAIFRKRHGMSPHELKEEFKESEGSPESKQAQHEARFLLMMSPPAKAMRAADVVIRNPQHIAVAIAGAFSNEPWVLRVGQGKQAAQVRRLARRYGRPQVRSVALARALAKAGEGADVPADLIAAVSEVAHWAHGLQQAPDNAD